MTMADTQGHKVRWGIVGAGRISRQFCHDIAFTDNAEITAVAARSGDSARRFADEFGIRRAHQGYQALFDDPEVDAVYIATPHNHHFAQARDALLAGKHVLCEKPFTVSSAECAELTRIASEQQRFLMEAMWTYFLPAIQQAVSWVEQGRIGKLLHVKGDFGYPIPYAPDRREYDARLNGGCLLEMGIYPLALALRFFGRLPDRTQLHCHKAPNGVEDDVSLLAEYGEQSASLATSFRARLPNVGFIVGDQGYIRIEDFFRAGSCSLHQLDECLERFEDGRQGKGFEFQIEAASDCILQGKLQSEIMPLSTSLLLQQQMEDLLRRMA